MRHLVTTGSKIASILAVLTIGAFVASPRPNFLRELREIPSRSPSADSEVKLLSEADVLEFALKANYGFEDEIPVIPKGTRIIRLEVGIKPEFLKGLGLSTAKRRDMALARMIASFLAHRPASVLEKLKSAYANAWNPKHFDDTAFDASRTGFALLRCLEKNQKNLINQMSNEDFPEYFQSVEPEQIAEEVIEINRSLDPKGREFTEEDLSPIARESKPKDPVITIQWPDFGNRLDALKTR